MIDKRIEDVFMRIEEFSEGGVGVWSGIVE